MGGDEEVERCGFGNCCVYGKLKKGMAVWCKFVSATANEKSSSGGSSQDVEAVAVVPPLLKILLSHHRLTNLPIPRHRQLQQEVKTRPTPKQDELKEKMGIEKRYPSRSLSETRTTTYRRRRRRRRRRRIVMSSKKECRRRQSWKTS